MPQLLHDVLEQMVAAAPDLQLARPDAEPDFVITAAHHGDRERCRRLHETYPRARMVAIDEQTGGACLCEPLGAQVSATDIVTAIRRAAARPLAEPGAGA